MYFNMFSIAYLNISKYFEVQKILFEHQVEAMRAHETTEDSRLGIKLMTLPESQISIETLKGTYETQGRFQKKKQNKKQEKTKKRRVHEAR